MKNGLSGGRDWKYDTSVPFVVSFFKRGKYSNDSATSKILYFDLNSGAKKRPKTSWEKFFGV